LKKIFKEGNSRYSKRVLLEIVARSIAALKVDVISVYHHWPAPVLVPNDKADDDATGHDHSHSHSHSHDHDHYHEHSHNSSSSARPLRNLPQIVHMLTHASPEFIPPAVSKLAIQIFTELAIAESYTHGISSKNNVHFHEVGCHWNSPGSPLFQYPYRFLFHIAHYLQMMAILSFGVLNFEWKEKGWSSIFFNK